VTKSHPLSVRLGETVNTLVADEARRSGRSRGAIVEELAEEAAKTRLFPGIGFRGRPRRAWVIGTGLDVWELIELLAAHGSSDAVRRAHPLVLDRHLRIAQAYAERFPAEIQEILELNRRPLEELRALYPFVKVPE
jgi:hypothetical protein